MGTPRATLDDLKSELKELGMRNPVLQDDGLFVMWFLLAYVTPSEAAAGAALTGGPNDKGVDAILIDEAARIVTIVQGKYRQAVGKKTESRSDVMSFAQTAHAVTDSDREVFNEFISGADPHVADRLKEARDRILKRGYRLWLYYVTLGKCSDALKKEAKKLARRSHKGLVDLEVLGAQRVMTVLRDYLDGVAPPIPVLELEMEHGRNVKVNGILQRFDGAAEIESWVFSMQGDDVAHMFKSAGSRLFARNIRGFLGKNTQVNKSIAETLASEPEKFFYYNNGITIVCDGAQKISHKGRDFLRVSNPQVINGQQTTRMLAEHERSNRNASVLVKVIQVPKDTVGGEDEFDALVSNIVAATNWQNQIKSSDLRSNDRRQIEIQRALRKVGYIYLRKKQSKAEAKQLVGGNYFPAIKKEELARAVAGCDLDPMVVRSGVERLFEDEYYDRVFPNSDPDFYLPRYRLLREVSWHSKGYPERGYAKWLVLNFLWSQLAPLVRRGSRAKRFVTACERQDLRIVGPLSNNIDRSFNAALRYYRANRGRGKKAIDVSRFFRSTKGRHKEFAKYWGQPGNKSIGPFERDLDRIKSALQGDG